MWLFPARHFVGEFLWRSLAYHIMHFKKHHSAHMVSIGIHSIRIDSRRIPFNTCRFNVFPFNTYAFKTSVRYVCIQNVSFQYLLHQQEWQWIWKTFPCTSLHQQEWQCISNLCMSFHVIAIWREWQLSKNPCSSLYFLAHIIAYYCIAREWTCNGLLAGGLLACLLACTCLLARLLWNNFLLLYSAGWDVRGLLEINPFVKNEVAMAQNCSEA